MQLDPSDGDAQRMLADLLSETGQVDEAVRVLRDASKREPANPVYDLMLGGILTKFGRNEEAIKLFEGMLRRFADNDDVVKIVHPSLSVVYVNQGNYAKGEAELQVLLKRYPDEPGPNNDLGYLYAEQGKNLEEAEGMIRKALQEDPDNEAYLDSLGWVLFKRGKTKEALDPLKRAVEKVRESAEQRGTNPDTTILEHLGDVHFQLRELGRPAMPGVKRREAPSRRSRRISACPRSARSSIHWNSSARSPSRRQVRVPSARSDGDRGILANTAAGPSILDLRHRSPIRIVGFSNLQFLKSGLAGIRRLRSHSVSFFTNPRPNSI